MQKDKDQFYRWSVAMDSQKDDRSAHRLHLASVVTMHADGGVFIRRNAPCPPCTFYQFNQSIVISR